MAYAAKNISKAQIKSQVMINSTLIGLIEKRITREDYDTISYFSKTKLSFDWPLVESAVKDGFTAYVMNFQMPNFEKITREQRLKIYGDVRKLFKSKGWTNIYFEHITDKVHVAVIQKV